MTKKAWQLAFLAIAIALCAAPAPAQDEVVGGIDRLRKRLEGGVLRWGGDAEGGAPYILRDPNDPSRVIGFEVELADALAENLSDKLERPRRAQFVQYEWVSLRQGLDKQDFDIILNGYEITPENRRGLLFSRPYYIFAQQLVVRRDEERIRELTDCRDARVGTLSGSAAETLLKKEKVRSIVTYDGQVEPYRDLALKRLDAVLLDTPIAIYYAGQDPKLKLVGERIGHDAYGIGLRANDADLAKALDDALSDLMVSGRLAAIYRKWHLWNEDQLRLARGPNLAQERLGLGFLPDGQPLAADAPGEADAVDLDILAESAEKWTFDLYGPLLLRAAGMTVFLTFFSMALAMTLGLVVALCRMYGPAPIRWLALVYVEFFRGIPLLLLLTFLYYGLPEVGGALSAAVSAVVRFEVHAAIVTAILGFGMNYAAYEAEIYRSSIQSVPLGQWEAGRALGMPEALTFRRIIFPQAFRTALGPMTNDFVAMFKDTSLVSVIAVRELTKEYQILSKSSGEYVKLGLLTAVLYLAMSVPLGYLSRYLEKRWGPGK